MLRLVILRWKCWNDLFLPELSGFLRGATKEQRNWTVNRSYFTRREPLVGTSRGVDPSWWTSLIASNTTALAESSFVKWVDGRYRPRKLPAVVCCSVFAPKRRHRVPPTPTVAVRCTTVQDPWNDTPVRNGDHFLLTAASTWINNRFRYRLMRFRPMRSAQQQLSGY